VPHNYAKLIQIPQFRVLLTVLGKDLCFVICDYVDLLTNALISAICSEFLSTQLKKFLNICIHPIHFDDGLKFSFLHEKAGALGGRFNVVQELKLDFSSELYEDEVVMLREEIMNKLDVLSSA
jgi:hypothetical protein